jgi:hypothetical protein
MSNQYGCVPINCASELKQQYSIATPATWRFEKGAAMYGGVEENIFSQPQKDEITVLGGRWFATAADFIAWFKT